MEILHDSTKKINVYIKITLKLSEIYKRYLGKIDIWLKITSPVILHNCAKHNF